MAATSGISGCQQIHMFRVPKLLRMSTTARVFRFGCKQTHFGTFRKPVAMATEISEEEDDNMEGVSRMTDDVSAWIKTPKTEVLCRYRTCWSIDLKFKPFFLGGVMKDAGNRSPEVVPNKGLYMIQDVKRLRRHYHIPIRQADGETLCYMLGKGTLLTMRFVTAVDMEQSDKVEELCRQLWVRMWSEDHLDIGDPDGIKEAALRAGLNESFIDNALSKSGSDAVKARLKAYTAEALEFSAFGTPTILVTDEKGEKHMVFGSDRFPIIADILGEKYEGPLTELAAIKF